MNKSKQTPLGGYIPIGQTAYGQVIPYSSVSDYYLLLNEPFNVLGNYPYYSDADYYLLLKRNWLPENTTNIDGVNYSYQKNAFFTDNIAISQQTNDEYKSEVNYYIDKYSAAPSGGDKYNYPNYQWQASTGRSSIDAVTYGGAALNFARDLLFPSSDGTTLISAQFLADAAVLKPSVNRAAVYWGGAAANYLINMAIKPRGKNQPIIINNSILNGYKTYPEYSQHNDKRTPSYNSDIVLNSTMSNGPYSKDATFNTFDRQLQMFKSKATPSATLKQDILNLYSNNYSLQTNSIIQEYGKHASRSIARGGSTSSYTRIWNLTIDPIYADIMSSNQGISTSTSGENRDAIKFWITNINDGRRMMTPAFLTGLSQQGGNAVWQQFNYIGAPYANFLYKGTEPRKISFTLKLTCLSRDNLDIYVSKLNFLRGIGFPSYNIGKPIKYQINGEKHYNSNAIAFPVPNVYTLTLGDILYQQYGFFESVDLSWDDQENFWNFNDRGSYSSSSVNDIELPMVTTIDIVFVCLYGKIPDSIHNEFYNFHSQASNLADNIYDESQVPASSLYYNNEDSLNFYA